MNLLNQQRRLGRLRAKIAGEYRFADRQNWLPCTVLDISIEGFSLEGKESFYKGDKISVKIPFPDRLIFLNAEVTNLSGKKAGCKIVAANENEFAGIQLILDKSLKTLNKTP